MTSPLATLELRFEVPSQNVTERRHWSARAAEKHALVWMVRLGLPVGGCPHGGCKRRLEVVAYRHRRIADYANLVGGCKTLLDALVGAGVLKDDSMRWVEVSYDQGLFRQAGYDQPTTVVRVFAVEPAPRPACLP